MIQLQALNKILNERSFSLVTLNNLDSTFFSDYTSEFNFIKSHYDLYGNIPDKVTFIDKFPDFDLLDVLESDKYIIDGLYEDRNKRNLAKTFNKVRDALMKGDTESAQNIYLNAVNNISESKHLQSVDIFNDTSRYDIYVDKCNSHFFSIFKLSI